MAADEGPMLAMQSPNTTGHNIYYSRLVMYLYYLLLQ